MDNISKKAIESFRGKIVRKDLTALMKRGANVPTYVLEYLLGMYCSSDDEAVVEDGVNKHDFYVEQQNKISAFAAKVHNGEITNAAGEKYAITLFNFTPILSRAKNTK